MTQLGQPSRRYADPRANLLGESEWEAMRPIVCRTLGLSAQPQPVLDALRTELERTYREVAQRLPNNAAVRFETVNSKDELILTPLEKVAEPASLVQLREAVAARVANFTFFRRWVKTAIALSLENG